MHAVTLGTLDLMSDGYWVMSFDASTPGRIRMNVDIDPGSTKQAIDLERSIRTQLNRATQAAQPASSQPWVTLVVQASLDSQRVEFPVRRGTVRPAVEPIAFEEGWLPGVFVELETLPYALGEPIEYGPFPVTGVNPTFHIDGVPGDLPALAEVRFTDQSDGVVVNRIRMGARSLPASAEGDVRLVLPVLDAGEEPRSEDSFGLPESITAEENWTSIGEVSGSAEDAAGLYDVWLRVKDGTASLGTPRNVTVSGRVGIARLQMNTNELYGLTTDTAFVQNSKATQEGSLLVMLVGTRPTRTLSTPAGWAEGPTTTSVNGGRVACFYMENAPSFPAFTTFTVPLSASATWSVTFLEYRGIASSGALDVSATNTVGLASSASSGTTPAMTQNYGLGLAYFQTSETSTGSFFRFRSVSPQGWVMPFRNTVRGVAQRILDAGGSQSATVTASLRAWSNLIVVFKGSEQELPGGSLPAGTYAARIVAVDSHGGLSAPSEEVSIRIPDETGLAFGWESGGGPAADWRIYLKSGADEWVYYTAGSANPQFELRSLDGAVTEDPPSTTTIVPADYRLRLGPESGGTFDIVTPALHTTLANDNWEPLYAGRPYLPGVPLPLAVSAPGWLLDVQGRSRTGVELAVDGVVRIPADEQQIDVRLPEENLGEQREWVFGTSVDMRSYGLLRETETATEVGRVMPIGYALLGPGDTTVVMLMTVAGGVWNVEDVAGEVSVIVRPRYEWLAGGV